MKKKRVFGTGGELLVHQLVAQGVKYAFTNTGSAEAGFFNALLTVPGVQPILLLAESLVLSAADGYAKASREAAFVNVHLAAGTRQGSGQLQNAYFDGSPMVVTAAMRDAGSFGDHNTLGSSGGFSQMGAVEDITKRRWEVWDARGIPTVTRRAFKEALTFPTGPVYVAYTSQALETNDVEAVIQAADAPHMGLLPEAGVIQSIWDALVNAERPLLVCGQDIGVAGAGEEILTLAERLALPVATGFFDYASFPVQHPNYVGQVENVSEEEYDVVCCVGYRQNTRGYPATCASPRPAPSSASATIRRCWATRSRSTPRCGATCATRCRALNGLWKAADGQPAARAAARGDLRTSRRAAPARAGGRGRGTRLRAADPSELSSRISPPGRCPRAPWWSRRISGTPIT